MRHGAGPEVGFRQESSYELHDAVHVQGVENQGEQERKVADVVHVVHVEEDGVALVLAGVVEPEEEDGGRERPEEEDEGGDDDVLLVLLQDGHRDEGDGEGEEGAELDDLLEDVHPERGDLVLLDGEGGVDEDEDGGADEGGHDGDEDGHQLEGEEAGEEEPDGELGRLLHRPVELEAAEGADVVEVRGREVVGQAHHDDGGEHGLKRGSGFKFVR